MTMKIIFRVYIFGILSRKLPNIFYQELRNSEFESQISLISSLLSPPPPPPFPLPLLLPPPPLSPSHWWSSTVARHRRWSPTVSPLQSLSHEISFMQMGALNSYDVSNSKFRYLKSNHTKSLLCKCVHWTPMSFQILNLYT